MKKSRRKPERTQTARRVVFTVFGVFAAFVFGLFAAYPIAWAFQALSSIFFCWKTVFSVNCEETERFCCLPCSAEGTFEVFSRHFSDGR